VTLLWEAPPLERSVGVVTGDVLTGGHLPKVLKMLRHAGFEISGLRMIETRAVDSMLENTTEENPCSAAVAVAVTRPHAIRKLKVKPCNPITLNALTTTMTRPLWVKLAIGRREERS